MVSSNAPASAAASPPPHVLIKDLSKRYRSARGDIVALQKLDLSFERGEFISLLGPSGCGKSTLLKIIAGIETPTTGRLELDGVRSTGTPDGLGIVFQRDVLLDWRTILENVMLPVEFANRRTADYKDRALELLRMFGLAEFAARFPWELSGGMRQRAAICRALLMDPKLLLMDEPFGALDALTRDDLNLELQRMWMRSGKTVLFVTHSIQEAILLSDRVVVMAARPGRVMEILEIDFPRPRTLAMREEPEFARLSRHIREIFEASGVFTNRTDS